MASKKKLRVEIARLEATLERLEAKNVQWDKDYHSLNDTYLSIYAERQELQDVINATYKMLLPGIEVKQDSNHSMDAEHYCLFPQDTKWDLHSR